MVLQAWLWSQPEGEKSEMEVVGMVGQTDRSHPVGQRQIQDCKNLLGRVGLTVPRHGLETGSKILGLLPGEGAAVSPLSPTYLSAYLLLRVVRWRRWLGVRGPLLVQTVRVGSSRVCEQNRPLGNMGGGCLQISQESIWCG